MCTFVLVTMIKALLASEAAPLVPFPVRGQGVPPALALQRYELIAGTPGSVFSPWYTGTGAFVISTLECRRTNSLYSYAYSSSTC